MQRWSWLSAMIVACVLALAGRVHAVDPAPADPDDDLSTAPLTIDFVSRLAERSHPILRRDTARIDSATGDAVQAGLYPNPRFDTNNPQVFTGAQSLFNGGIMQEFVVKGKLRLDRAAATKVVHQNQFAYVQDRVGLLTAVRQQFYTTLAAQRRVEILHELQQITQRSLNVGRKLEQAGEGSGIDVLLLGIDAERVEANLVNAEALLQGERKQLSSIVGIPNLVDRDVEGSLYAKTPDFDEEVMQKFVTNDSALIEIARLDVERNRILLKRAEVEPYPNPTLGPAFQYGTTPGSEQYWLTVTFPIPTSDRNQGKIHAARANVRDSTENLNTVQLELLRHVADALSRYRALRAQELKYRKQIIPDALRTMRKAQSGYAEGVFDFSRFLQAQRTVVEANMDNIGILESVWTTAAELAGLLQLNQFP